MTDQIKTVTLTPAEIMREAAAQVAMSHCYAIMSTTAADARAAIIAAAIRALPLPPNEQCSAKACAEPASWEDREDDLSAAVIQSNPVYSKDYDSYIRALELVSNRHSKGALVNLVCHLLHQAKCEHDQWQPIETAPRDGTEFLTYAPGNAHAYYNFDRRPALVISKWKEGRLWKNRPDNMPTHWMPLPAAPKGGE